MKFSLPEKLALWLTAAVLLFSVGWFARDAVGGWYQVSGDDLFPDRGEPSPALTFRPGPNSLVDLNSAALEDLTALPGIGPKAAQAILDYRDAHGFFTDPGQLMEVPGIGRATYEALADYITVKEAAP